MQAFLRVFMGIAGFIFGAAFVYGFFRLLGFLDQFWEYSSLSIAAYIYIPSTLGFILMPFRSKPWRESYFHYVTVGIGVPAAIITLAAVHALSFACLCSWLQACPPATCAQPAFQGIRADATIAEFLMLVAKNVFDLLTLNIPSKLNFNPLVGFGITVQPRSQLAIALNLSYSLALGMGLVSVLMRFYRENILRRTDWHASTKPLWQQKDHKTLFMARDSALNKSTDTLGSDISFDVKIILHTGNLETTRQIEHLVKTVKRVRANKSILKYARERIHDIKISQEEATNRLQATLNEQIAAFVAELKAEFHV
jgi:hypothetical protein